MRASGDSARSRQWRACSTANSGPVTALQRISYDHKLLSNRFGYLLRRNMLVQPR